MEFHVENLCKSYGAAPVLCGVSFSCKDEILCFMAPSGVGKSTLLRLLMGLETPDSGTITGLEGCRWAAVFQEDRLLPHLDALGNLRFALGPAFDREKALTLLDQLGLGGVGGKRACAYSGGMKRRLALARALLAESDALVLDEPFTGLDGESRARCIRCLLDHAAGKPVLLSTHDGQDPISLHARIIRL